MQAALASLHSTSSRQPTPSFSGVQPNGGAGGAVVTPSGHPLPDLDPLRLRLVQLIDALTILHSQLSYLAFNTPAAGPSSAAPGVLPFPELVGRYNLLLTHLTAVQGLLSSQGEKDRETEKEREEGAAARRKRKDRDRDVKRERWEAVSVVPAVEVDEGRDWMVGMLLRTKQTPEVEATQARLTTTLPTPFSTALSSSTHTTAPDPSAFPAALQAQTSLLTAAYDKVCALKEFNSEGEEWDWKARVRLDEEEEGEKGEGEGEKMQTEDGGGGAKRAWTAKEVQTYLRTGKKPDV
ncbi:hypothetical protein JCM6882_002602 [Rhodosporidiobolus microsporus]